MNEHVSHILQPIGAPSVKKFAHLVLGDLGVVLGGSRVVWVVLGWF